MVFGALFLRGRRLALKNTPNFKMTADLGDHKNKPNLKVMFVYNGHTWDAHEVLGIKPGSSLNEIKAAFERTMKNNDSGAHDFIKTALAAIFQNLKDQGFEPK